MSQLLNIKNKIIYLVTFSGVMFGQSYCLENSDGR